MGRPEVICAILSCSACSGERALRLTSISSKVRFSLVEKLLPEDERGEEVAGEGGAVFIGGIVTPGGVVVILPGEVLDLGED